MKNGKLHLLLAFLIAIFICLISGLSASAGHRLKSDLADNKSQALTWTEVASPVTDTLSSISMVSANDGWAVGSDSTLLHYDGTAWITETIPGTANLYSVSMSSRHNGWAVGSSSTPPYHVLLHYDGIGWQPVPLPGDPWLIHLTDVSVPNDTSAWVSAGAVICAPKTPCPPAAVIGGIAYWNGSAWTFTQISNVLPSSISMINDSDGWAVGTEVVPLVREMRSVILHWDGHEWNRVEHPSWVYPPGNYLDILAEVTALDATIAWVSVTNGSAFLHWDGLNWSDVHSPVRGAPSIAAISTLDAWAVGSYGDIGFWDGVNWNMESSPVTETLRSVAMVTNSDVWAVGDEGTILHAISFTQYLPLSVK